MGASDRLRFGPFELDRAEVRLYRDGNVVPLRPKTFAVLDFLLSNRGRLVRKEEILEAVWPETAVSDTVLKVCIREARLALSEDPGKPRFIETAHRMGYRFIARVRTSRLPRPLTSFIGREKEVADVRRLLESSRLLTLTGPGGCGKTRLAIEAAAAIDAEDGVFWVDFAPLTDSSALFGFVASALRLTGQGGWDSEELLARELESRKAILVLDNCEHLVESLAALARRLLLASKLSKILATSREALRVEGEVSYFVPSLSEGEAVRLFASRATNVRPDFALGEENRSQITEICRRLDGIPLAIELAASRFKTLGLHQMVTRLEDRFRLLGEDPRAALPRHRTLRAAIDWSYDLLSAEEKRLLARLSIFPGSFSLEAAEFVCGADRLLERLSLLVEKSLAQIDADERYLLLEIVRQYGREKLESAADRERLRRRHLDFFLGMAKNVEPDVNGVRRASSLERLEREHGNLSAAMAHALELGDSEAALELGSALYWFWFHQGHWSEGRSSLTKAIAQAGSSKPTKALARALFGLGMLSWARGEGNEARRLLGESVRLSRSLEDESGLAYALQFHAVTSLGEGARNEGSESVTLFQKIETDRFGLSTSLATRGIVALAEECYDEARDYFEESIAVARESRDDWALALPLRNLGIVAFRQGRIEQARAALRESLQVQARRQEKWFLSRSLESLAAVLAVAGEGASAARLFGAGEILREKVGASVLPIYQQDYDRGVAALRAMLSPAELRSLWDEGRSLTSERALELALEFI